MSKEGGNHFNRPDKCSERKIVELATSAAKIYQQLHVTSLQGTV